MHIGNLLSRTAVRYPSRPAWGREHPLNYRQADARVNRVANALLGLGLERGDRVGFIAWNGPELLEVMLAAMRAGLVIVPLNVRLHASEHQALAQDAELAALVYDGDLAAHVTSLDLPGVRRIRIGAGDTADPDLESLLARASDRAPAVEPGPEDLAWIFYTSGTTGTSKGAMLTHRNLLTLTATNLLHYDTTPDDVVLHAIPLSHAGGFFMLHHVARGAGHAFLGSRRFDPEGFCHVVQSSKVTAVALLPTMIHMVLATGATSCARLGSLKTFAYGGTAMPAQHLEEGLARIGRVFVQSYGLGEAPMSATLLSAEEHTSGRLLSAGRATALTSVRVQDDQGASVPAGEPGEVAIRGDLVMSGYWRQPEATAKVLKDGWLLTGDIGTLDDEGYLFLLDRKKDLIKTGGATVSPREVEEAIYRHPAVAEVAVVGVPDEQWGEAIRAVCVLKPGAKVDATEIVEACTRHIASFKKPRSVEFVQELPKAPSGKLLRRELRARYWQDHARKI